MEHYYFTQTQFISSKTWVYFQTLLLVSVHTINYAAYSNMQKTLYYIRCLDIEQLYICVYFHWHVCHRILNNFWKCHFISSVDLFTMQKGPTTCKTYPQPNQQRKICKGLMPGCGCCLLCIWPHSDYSEDKMISGLISEYCCACKQDSLILENKDTNGGDTVMASLQLTFRKDIWLLPCSCTILHHWDMISVEYIDRLRDSELCKY